MALTLNGVKNSLDATQLPSGYSRPSVTEFSDWEYKRTLALTVLKSTVENATASTTMTNIIDNGTIGLDKQCEDILNQDFDTSGATITAWADWTTLSNNYVNVTGSGAALTDTAMSYTCTVVLYVKEG